MRISSESVARLPQEAPAGKAEHIAAVAAEERTAAAGIAAADIVASHYIAVAEVGAVVAEHIAAAAAVEVAGPAAVARLARAAGRHIPSEVVATQAPAAEVVLPRRKPPPPAPARRKKGSRSSREEHRVRIADKSS